MEDIAFFDFFFQLFNFAFLKEKKKSLRNVIYTNFILPWRDFHLKHKQTKTIKRQ